MEASSTSHASNIDDAANKKKYAILFGYCGTGYHGSQTFLVLFSFIYVETKALIRLTMILLLVYIRLVVSPMPTSLMRIGLLRCVAN